MVRNEIILHFGYRWFGLAWRFCSRRCLRIFGNFDKRVEVIGGMYFHFSSMGCPKVSKLVSGSSSENSRCPHGFASNGPLGCISPMVAYVLYKPSMLSVRI